VVTASALPLAGCTGAMRQERSSSGYAFPQGIASADPQAEAVVLWTRVVPKDPAADKVTLLLEAARDPALSEVVARRELIAERTWDFTVRVFLNGLEPDRPYFYRFTAPDGGQSRVGRTRTAPAADASAELRLAVVSCQHYETGYFHAYRRLLQDDTRAAEHGKLHVVLHVGDFIYTDIVSEDFEAGPGEFPIVRRVGQYPSGGAVGQRQRRFPQTLEDYRHLYRVYLSDPDLQTARATWPFVCTWDDHELVNDVWQSFVGDRGMQTQKLHSNQAWFEYVPAALSAAPAGPAGQNPARDFTPVSVRDAPPADLDEDYLSHEPNNLAAIGSLTLYRALSWGRMADLIMVDGRSYRGERGVDDAQLNAVGTGIPYPSAPIPPQLIRTLNAGHTANGGQPPAEVDYYSRALPNTRQKAPLASVLGAAQKQWLKKTLVGSTAAWRIVCNNSPMMRFGFDTSFRQGGHTNAVWWTDSWDGYPIERQELMKFVLDAGIGNVVSVTGDRHAHFAGMICDDYEGAVPVAVMPEFAGAAISALDRCSIQAQVAARDPELAKLVQFQNRQSGSAGAHRPAINAWMLFGAAAARTLVETGDVLEARRRARDDANPHLTYADSDAYGYFTARFSPDRLDVEFVTIPAPAVDTGDAPRVLRRVRFSTPAWSRGQPPKLLTAGIEGEPPLLGVK
jgi:alkaline phosphatase D